LRDDLAIFVLSLGYHTLNGQSSFTVRIGQNVPGVAFGTDSRALPTNANGVVGLGLVLCRKFCQMMGGEVSVTSEFGKGSVFTVTLPKKLPATSAPKQSYNRT
jgi:light-regulated signal transduction histidine kinase (bacteriophytochrome)